MKSVVRHFVLLACILLLWRSDLKAESTTDETNRFAYGANIGWINWRDGVTEGAFIGTEFCTGFVYSANAGWIHLGRGPSNDNAYSNVSSADYGVNVSDGNKLRGLAYGANVGWIKFETNGNPHLDLSTGILEGFAYGANVGWISLSNTFAYVQTMALLTTTSTSSTSSTSTSTSSSTSVTSTTSTTTMFTTTTSTSSTSTTTTSTTTTTTSTTTTSSSTISTTSSTSTSTTTLTSTIDEVNKFAYGANIGWVNWRDGVTEGVFIGTEYCTGFVYSANSGWIHLGRGPSNGNAYSNVLAADYGVNVSDGNKLRGLAYGANVGWIKFESTGNPRVNLNSGILEGFAYGANIGWISLSNAFAYVQTTPLSTTTTTTTTTLTTTSTTISTTISTTTTSTTTTTTTSSSTTTTTTSTTTFCNMVEHMESFESYADGLPMESVPGWNGNPGAANISTDAGLIAKLLSYVATSPPDCFQFPIPGDTHDQILCVNPNQTITDCIAGTEDLLYTDFMWLPGITGDSGSIPAAGLGDQLAMYVDGTTRQLTVWHEDSGTPEYLTLNSSTIGTCEWVRVTICQDYTGNRYSIRLNQGAPIEDAKGWDAPVGGSQPGSWFNMVQKDGFMSRFIVVSAAGASYIDDLQVKLQDPAPTTTTSTSSTTTSTTSTTTTLAETTTTSTTTTSSTTSSTTLPPGMVWIPAGVNTGVGPDFGAYSLTNETAFYMDKYEVTKALWDEVASWAATNGYDISAAGGSGKASDHPVQDVTWYECVKWCNARSQRDGREATYYTDAGYTSVYKTGTVSGVSAPYVKGSANGYRLPTEVEWEYAARGGATSHRFPWSDSDEIQHARANYWSSSSYYDTSPTRLYHPDYDDGGVPYTSPVGDFAANGYGVHDMAGNVFEWCYDWLNAGHAQWRVLRGGGWYNGAIYCWVAYRYYNPPGSSNYYFGFRAVLPPGQTTTSSTTSTTTTTTTSSTTTSSTTSSTTTTTTTSSTTTTTTSSTTSSTTTSSTTTTSTTTTTTSTTTSTTTFCNVVEYMESFESYADGLAMESVPGWNGNPGAANISTDAGLIAKLLSYLATSPPPIPEDTHDQILCVNPNQEITDCISGMANVLYTDFMWLPGITSGSAPAAGNGDQLVLYVDESTRKLTIWHDDSGPEYLTLANSPTIGTGEWVRVTLSQDYTGDRYQVRLNQGNAITDAKGYDAPVGGSQPGSWFNMVQKNGFMSRFIITSAANASYVDDLQVKLNNPISTAFEGWITQFSLPPNEDGQNDDPDGDGLDNFGEWIAGTDPNDPNDVFRIFDVDFLTGSNCVFWRVGTNTQITTPFMLWRSTNLVNMVFEEIASGIPRDPSGTNIYYDTNPPAGPAMYRAILPTNHP